MCIQTVSAVVLFVPVLAADSGIFGENVGQVAVGEYEIELRVVFDCKIYLLADIRESFKVKNAGEGFYSKEGFMLCKQAMLASEAMMRKLAGRPLAHLRACTATSRGGIERLSGDFASLTPGNDDP